MITSIGLMIAGYIVLRCVEIFCMDGGRYRNGTAHGVTIFLAALTLIGVLAIAADLVSRSQSIASQMSSAPSSLR
jgi:hypothetical protein